MPILNKPVVQKIPRETTFSKSQEIQEMLEKDTVRKVPQTTHQFLNNLFLVEKKDRGCRTVINLRNFNSFLPYE